MFVFKVRLNERKVIQGPLELWSSLNWDSY